MFDNRLNTRKQRGMELELISLRRQHKKDITRIDTMINMINDRLDNHSAILTDHEARLVDGDPNV
jgi:chaperonin cofactor prefoldin